MAGASQQPPRARGPFAPRLRRFDRDVGLVLASFVALIAVENLAVGIGYRAEFVGTWEMGSARRYLSPIALGASIPVAVAIVALARLASSGRAWAVAIVGAIAGAAAGLGVSTGRRMGSLALRAPFVAAVALASGVVAWTLARHLPRATRARPRAVVVAGVLIAALSWLADAFVLPRLYPAFHLAMLLVALGGWAVTALVLWRTRAAGPVALAAIALAAASVAWSPHAARAVAPEENLRRVLLERAPVLGRSVLLAARLAPPPPMEEDEAASATLTTLRDREGARALDWRGRDLVLVTVDALRADHLSSYGYARRTTPNIDALAARGARFDRAYCPTPHTSYSITSMMTGKYTKPLLALGADDESETWPVQLRRYGYRTAAFYPPAVFFIDEHRFRRMQRDGLGFEYRKEEFARPELRRAQIERYLSSAPKDTPLFLWVHLFEPHEPYEMHPEHPFAGDPRVDAYDSEVAAADALVGEIVRLVSEARGAEVVFIVSADHGEEHGDHGGRYHGTTVYEEQVRVPLVVVGPGVSPRVVGEPVQTIDLLPTALAALDVPIPPRLRGRDLGPALAGAAPASEEGLAFAETDDYTLLARGADRLVCARKIASCTLFDVSRDPGQRRPVVDRPARVAELKRLTVAIERETGKVEASTLPEALRRGLQGDRDAAEDVAPLLDDAEVEIRRLAARCAFKLRAPELATQLRRALAKDEDAEVQRWSALAIVRLGEAGDAKAEESGGAGALVSSLLRSGSAEERVAAALALGERGDPRGEQELVAEWGAAFAPGASRRGELDEARELLGALATLRSKAAVPALVRSLGDVRLRPHVVEALERVGDPRAKEPLLRAFAEERYLHLRPLEARALVALGAGAELRAPLARFAGTPEPMADALAIARAARLLAPEHGGKDGLGGASAAQVRLRLSRSGPARILVLAGDGPLSVTVAGVELTGAPATGGLHLFEAPDLRAGDVEVGLRSEGGLEAVWLVPRAPEIPPPPPRAWDAGAPLEDPPSP